MAKSLLSFSFLICNRRVKTEATLQNLSLAFNKIIYLKCLEQCLKHGYYSLSGSYSFYLFIEKFNSFTFNLNTNTWVYPCHISCFLLLSREGLWMIKFLNTCINENVFIFPILDWLFDWMENFRCNVIFSQNSELYLSLGTSAATEKSDTHLILFSFLEVCFFPLEVSRMFSLSLGD